MSTNSTALYASQALTENLLTQLNSLVQFRLTGGTVNVSTDTGSGKASASVTTNATGNTTVTITLTTTTTI